MQHHKMSGVQTRTRILTWFAAGSVFASLLLIGVHLRSAAGNSKPEIPTKISVRNHTQVLNVISIEPSSESIYSLTLKNESDKTIAGFAYRLTLTGGEYRPIGSRCEENIGILPGSTLTINHIAVPPQWQHRSLVLDVLCAYFTDGSGEGDGRIIQAFRDRELGFRMMENLLTPMLIEVTHKPDRELPKAIDELPAKVGRIPDIPTEVGSFAFRAGYKDRKALALEQIEQLRQAKNEGTSLLRTKLRELTDRDEELPASRLQ